MRKYILFIVFLLLVPVYLWATDGVNTVEHPAKVNSVATPDKVNTVEGLAAAGGGACSDLPEAEGSHTYSILLESGTSNSYWTGLDTAEKNRYGTDPWRVYSTMAAWETARDGESSNGATEVLEILGSWTADDTTEVYFDGWTAGAHAEVIAYGDARTTGVWSDSKYRITGDADPDTAAIIDIEDITVELDGIQAELDTPQGAYDSVIQIEGVDGSEIRNCILVMTSGQGTNNKIASITNNNATFINVIGYLSTGNSTDGFWQSGTPTVNYYNVLSFGFSDGFEDDGGTSACVNCISLGNGTDFDAIDSVTYSASDDVQAGTGNVQPASWAAVFTDDNYATSFDFQLQSDDTDCKDAGSDLSGTFTDDIKGDTRSDWDIGPFEYVP